MLPLSSPWPNLLHLLYLPLTYAPSPVPLGLNGYHTSIRRCGWRHSLRLCPCQPPTVSCFPMEARLSLHVEASYLSLFAPPASTHGSVEPSGGPHTGYLPGGEHLLPQLQGIRRC